MEKKSINRETKKTQRFLSMAEKGLSNSGLGLLDLIHEVEDDLIKYKEDVAKETQAINEAIVAAGKNAPDLNKVLESVRGKPGKDSQVPGPKGDSPTVEELTSLIVPLIPEPIPGKTPTFEEIKALIPPPIKGEKGDTPAKNELLALITPLIPEPIPGKNGSPDSGDQIVQKINELPIEQELLIEKEHIEGLTDFETLTNQRIEAVRQVAAKIIHGPLGMQVEVGGVKKGWIKTLDFTGGVSYSKVNGLDTLTFAGGTTDILFADNETPTGLLNGSNTTFTLAHEPSPTTSLELYLNSVLQIQGVDYTLSGSTITYTTAPNAAFSGLPHKAFYRYGTVSGATAFTELHTIVSGQTTPVTVTAPQSGNIFLLDSLTGLTYVLPAATGSGAIYRFFVTVLATSNSYIIKVPNASTVFIGSILNTQDSNTTVGQFTAADSDTITLDGSTTGNVTKGEWIEILDIATNIFSVKGQVSYNSSIGNPFSATV